MAESEDGVSQIEQLQDQLIKVKETNRQLLEECDKKDEEIRGLLKNESLLKTDLFRANSTIAKSKKLKDLFVLEQEVELTRLKLNVQEEEFRLQQSTLLSELNKVVSQNESLKTSLEHSKLESLQDQIKSSPKINEASTDSPIESLNEHIVEDSNKLHYLETENSNLKCKNSALQSTVENLQISTDKIRNQHEEMSTKLAYFKQQVSELNEKLRKKQESYQLLSDDKERQYAEFKKSLDGVVAKKDAEIKDLVAQMTILKKELAKVKEESELRISTVDSTESECDRLKKLNVNLNEQVELLQIQLQESLSANDCLSGQLQQATQEVSALQQQFISCQNLADERKTLVDDMNCHMENMKDEFKLEKERILSEHVLLVESLKEQITNLKSDFSSLENVSGKLGSLNASLDDKNAQIRKLTQQLEEARVHLEMTQIQHEEFVEKQNLEFGQKLEAINGEHKLKLDELLEAMQNLQTENGTLLSKIENYKQETKDKLEQLTVVERKHGHIVKDLKRQVQTEKKRADRLQERLQEILTDGPHSRSPGLEDIKFHDIGKDLKVGGDAGSVSSWTVVGGNHKEADRQSNADDRDSESSITLLERDNQDLIGRIAQLQRQNFELTEKVHILEESSSAMADDLVRKTALIEQFVKDKPYIGSSSSLNHQTAASPPMSDSRLPQSLRKMLDIVKQDQTACEIRDMNKRLQIMLEETLTKNMHLQRDLETISKEAARLAAFDPEKR